VTNTIFVLIYSVLGSCKIQQHITFRSSLSTLILGRALIMWTKEILIYAICTNHAFFMNVRSICSAVHRPTTQIRIVCRLFTIHYSFVESPLYNLPNYMGNRCHLHATVQGDSIYKCSCIYLSRGTFQRQYTTSIPLSAKGCFGWLLRTQINIPDMSRRSEQLQKV
jgi:hypothetical protein